MAFNKKIATASMILLMIIATVSLTTIVLPTVNAQPPEPLTKQTFAYVGLIPSSVGVNQEVLIHLGIYSTTAGTDYGWEGLTVTVTKPDGTTQTLGPFTTDSTGGTGTSYTPTEVGTYTFQSHFPEQQVPIPYFDFNMGLFFPEGSIFLASNSEIVNLVVTEEPIPFYPDIPLPAEFWSRPVDSQFRNWFSISGNWLEIPSNRYAPHNDAPQTAHILWAKPQTNGGLAGGITGEHGMEEGDAYEGKWQNPIIINGVLYYNKYGIEIFGRELNDANAVIAVDLRTGEELWIKEDVRFSFGQTLYFDSWNYHGVYDYLWEVQGNTWNAYDPFSGDWSWSITDIPSGIRYTGSNGEFYILVTDYTNGWMALWNQTKLGNIYGAMDFFDPAWAQGSFGRNVENRITNGSTAYSWNVTIPTDLPPIYSGLLGEFSALFDDRLIGANLSPTRDALNIWAINLKQGQEGQVIFNTVWNPPASWQTGLNSIRFAGHTEYGAGGVFILTNKEERVHIAFSSDNGAYLWQTEQEHYLQGLTIIEVSIVDDKAYSTGVSGVVYCYDINTGNTLWTYENKDPYNEYLFGDNWWAFIPFISDGKVYLGHYEHSPVDPKPRGAPFVCLDAETGEEIWRIDGMFRETEWGGEPVIGDSIIATLDTYTNLIYAVGKGPTQTTVTAPDAGIALGTTVVIRGMVTDISAGTKSPEIAARFPNGVACVSDADMSEWMLYVYKQFPMPMDVAGVSVTLDVVDANGNFRNIGTATTDSSGFYSMHWQPDIPGKYTVIATFEGTEGYYPSYAETAFAVDEIEAQIWPTPDPTPAPMTDTYLIGFGIAILAAVIIFGILLLRKK